jgi:hypothetical protein
MIAVPSMLLGRKGALLVVALGSAALIAFVALPALAAFEAQREERADALDQIAQFRGEEASGPAMKNALEAVRAQAAATPGVIQAATTPLAAAQLQTEIKDVVQSNAGDLRSAQALAPSRDNGFDRVTVQCDLTVPASHLKDLLYAVEVHTPYFFVDHVDITAPLTPSSNGGAAVEPTLEIRWTIHAYRWAQA